MEILHNFYSLEISLKIVSWSNASDLVVPHNWSATFPDLNSMDYSVSRWMKKWFIAKLQDALLGQTLDAADSNRKSLWKMHHATCAAHNWVTRFTVSLGGISENMLQGQVRVNWRKFYDIRLHSYFKSIKFFNYFSLFVGNPYFSF